jgi:NAD(P) transhydrogenase subunit beta
VTLNTWIDLVYLLAAMGFILALKGLSSPKQARNGNLLAAAAAAVAVGMTFAYPSVRAHSLNLVLTLVAMAVGAAVAVPAARRVKMTAMPQMVAIFNGVGGGAATASRPPTASARFSSAYWWAACRSPEAPSPSPNCRS